MRFFIGLLTTLIPLYAEAGIVYHESTAGVEKRQLLVPHVATPPVVTYSNARYWADNYRGRIWSHPVGLYTHLIEHGYSDNELAGLNQTQLENLHSADHEGLVSPARSQPIHRQAVVYQQSYASPCPGGRCPVSFGRRQW